MFIPVCLVGDHGVGLKTLIAAYTDNHHYDSGRISGGIKKTTVDGINIAYKLSIDNKLNSRYRRMSSKYSILHPNTGAHAFIVAFDLTDPQSFKNVDEYVKTIRAEANRLEVDIFLVATKSDHHEIIIDNGSIEEKVKKLGLNGSFRCSGKNNEGVDLLFDGIASHCARKNPSYDGMLQEAQAAEKEQKILEEKIARKKKYSMFFQASKDRDESSKELLKTHINTLGTPYHSVGFNALAFVYPLGNFVHCIFHSISSLARLGYGIYLSLNALIFSLDKKEAFSNIASGLAHELVSLATNIANTLLAVVSFISRTLVSMVLGYNDELNSGLSAKKEWGICEASFGI